MRILLTFLMLLIIQTIQTSIKIGCKDDSSCNSGKVFTYTNLDNGGVNSSCANDGCDVGIEIQYEVRDCKLDFYGQYCSTQICLESTQYSMCYDKNNACSSEYQNTIQCGQCSQNCQNGVCITQSSLQNCVENSYCKFDSQTVKLSNCANSKDIFGQTCQCCIQNGIQGAVIGFCSTTFPFDGEQLKIFIFENLLKIKFLVLIGIILFLIN